jgi:hypothetical protein
VSYRYVERDLLDEPEQYFFSAFEGHDLLRSWLAVRRGFRVALPAGAPAAEPGGAVPQPGVADVELRPLLLRLVASRAGGADPPATAAWQRVLLHKFEVFKRLRATYGADLRMRGDAFAEVDDYAWFALLLATTPELDRSLDALSCLLKVGDVLCSVGADRLTAAGGAAARRALELEEAAVMAVAVAQGVQIEGPS